MVLQQCLSDLRKPLSDILQVSFSAAAFNSPLCPGKWWENDGAGVMGKSAAPSWDICSLNHLMIIPRPERSGKSS